LELANFGKKEGLTMYADDGLIFRDQEEYLEEISNRK
jgi:hypothetical protein